MSEPVICSNGVRKRGQGTGCLKVLDKRFGWTLREVASSRPLLRCGLDEGETKSESGAGGMRVARGRGCRARWESEIVWCVRRVRRRPSWNVVGLNAGNRGVGLGPEDFFVASSFFLDKKAH